MMVWRRTLVAMATARAFVDLDARWSLPGTHGTALVAHIRTRRGQLRLKNCRSPRAGVSAGQGERGKAADRVRRAAHGEGRPDFEDHRCRRDDVAGRRPRLPSPHDPRPN